MLKLQHVRVEMSYFDSNYVSVLSAWIHLILTHIHFLSFWLDPKHKSRPKKYTQPYHDSGQSRDRSETGDACGVTGIQHIGNHPTNTGCHKSGVQSMTTRERQGRAVQNTWMERGVREKLQINICINLSFSCELV